MEPVSMTSTFIAACRREVKAAAVEKPGAKRADPAGNRGGFGWTARYFG
jgi:hypothetical protein